MKRIKILSIPFDHITKAEAIKVVLKKLEEKKQKTFFMATPNPEMLLTARKNAVFRKILNETDLNIADGSGIIFAAKFQKTPLPERITGVDFMQEICQKSRGKKIFLLGAQTGVAEKTKQVLEKKIPSIQIVGTYPGSAKPEDEQKICSMITKSDAEILFVAFGAPKQELWITRNMPNLPNVKVVMGIGGAFDFISGVRKRAPVWMRKISLEWLYRLIQEPKRIKRMYHATVKFPVVFFLNRK